MKHFYKNNRGFTLAELLIVVAIIAVLVAIAIPVFTNQLEKSRESTDLANARAAYAEVMAAAVEEDYKTIEFDLAQKADDWQSADTLTIGGITHIKGDESSNPNWQGIPGAGGKCTVSFSVDSDSDGVVDSVLFIWDGGGAATAYTPSFVNATTSTTMRWRMKDVNNTGVKVLTYAENDPGDFSLNYEPISVPKGTTITFDATNECRYSYYILDKDGNVIKDSSWFGPNNKNSSYTVNEDGYQLLVTTKLRTYNESTGQYDNLPTAQITDEMKQNAINGVHFSS